MLFADIVGSTELISGLDAEEAMERLQLIVAAMARAVRLFDGTILRTLGDGLKAAFGAPIAREEHALLAAQASLAIMDAVAEMPNAPKIRIGLHAGEVVAGTLDTGSSMELEAQGLTVHLASRVEQAAAAGEILLTGSSKTLIAGYCDTEYVGSRSMKGIAEPVDLYRLLGFRPAVASAQFRGNDLARLRGRETELKILRDAYLMGVAGEAQVIGIKAPAGAGKSRLCYEFVEWCRQNRIEVVEGRASILGQATPLQPVLEMLRSIFRLDPTMSPEAANARVRGRLAVLELGDHPDIPILLDFLGYTPPGTQLPRLDATARLARLCAIVRAMIKAGGPRMSIVIIDDMHWIDEASAVFMEAVIDAVAGTRHLVLLNFRPVWTSPYQKFPYYSELELEELTERDSLDMASELIGPDPSVADLAEKIAERSAGNPFFTEQLVLTLVQSGVLRGERGAYALSPSAPADVALPMTIETVIGARIDGLGKREKSIAQIASILGKEFPQALVEQMAGIATAQTHQLLQRLCDAEMLHMNVKLDVPMADWESFVRSALDEMHRASRVGFAANFLARPNPDAPPGQLYCPPPEQWASYCRESLGCEVEILAEYGLREYTLLAHRKTD